MAGSVSLLLLLRSVCWLGWLCCLGATCLPRLPRRVRSHWRARITPSATVTLVSLTHSLTATSTRIHTHSHTHTHTLQTAHLEPYTGRHYGHCRFSLLTEKGLLCRPLCPFHSLPLSLSLSLSLSLPITSAGKRPAQSGQARRPSGPPSSKSSRPGQNITPN